ncbi:MAG: pyridoxal phosphate-dependent aminotransferase [Alphaproteobacteria bacterium]|nr:pyridoxal phosphate-dependent aminotransferase [Alphaproteobacteria bacterium]
MPHIAKRLSRVKPSPTMAITKLSMEMKSAGRDTITLSQGEPDFDTIEDVKEAGIRAIREGKTKYTAVDGTPELKKAICAKLKRENNITATPDQILVSSGGKMVLYAALMATIDPGDEVIIPAPYWVSYPDMVQLAEGEPKFVRCPENNGFRMRPEDLEAAITPRTKMLILNSPSNPTGAASSAEDIRKLADVLMRHPHVLVMTDEIYEHLLYDGFRTASIAGVEPRLADRTITVNGMSKGYSMTGWRIGYACGPKDIIKAMSAIQSQSVSSPNTIAQVASVQALTGPQDYIQERNAIFKERRDLAVKMLNETPGLSCHRPEGAFYVFPNCAGVIGKTMPNGRRIETDEDFVLGLLEAEGVAAVHGTAFGMSPYFRISYALSTEELKEALMRIQRFCKALR